MDGSLNNPACFLGSQKFNSISVASKRCNLSLLKLKYFISILFPLYSDYRKSTMPCSLSVQGQLSNAPMFSLEMSTTHTSLAVKRNANARSLPKHKRNMRIMPWNRMLEVCLKFSDLPGSRRDKGNHDWSWASCRRKGRKANNWTGCSWLLIGKCRNIRWDSPH